MRILNLQLFFYIGLILILFPTSEICAQVTIGSAEPPSKGSLLQLKNITSILNGDDNANKGLGLPRVALVALDQLEPCVVTNAPNKKIHKGLLVYNTTDNSALSATLQKGIYVWDGDMWQTAIRSGGQGFGPWYKVDDPTIPARDNDTDSHLNAKAVVGGKTVLHNATLSVHGDLVTDGKNNVFSGQTILGNTITPLGSTVAPLVGAVLDVKERNHTSTNLANSDKGIIYPRVHLTNKDKLYPMFENNGSGGYKKGTTSYVKVTEDRNHTGLIVYNVNEAGDFLQGLHIWNGNEWKMIEYSTIIKPEISSLICPSAQMIPGNYIAGVPYTGILKIPYIGGNGGMYGSNAMVGPITVNGLSLEVSNGKLAVGGGEIIFRVSGTPTVSSPASLITFPVNFLGKSCSVTVGGENSSLNIRNLKANVNVNVKYLVAGPSAGANELVFDKEIKISEAGNYAFSLRLYGGITALSTRVPFYAYLCRNGASNILDAAEIDVVTINYATDYSYSLTLAGAFESGDIVRIYMQRDGMGQTGFNWTLKAKTSNSDPVRTSLVYWKL